MPDLGKISSPPQITFIEHQDAEYKNIREIGNNLMIAISRLVSVV